MVTSVQLIKKSKNSKFLENGRAYYQSIRNTTQNIFLLSLLPCDFISFRSTHKKLNDGQVPVCCLSVNENRFSAICAKINEMRR